MISIACTGRSHWPRGPLPTLSVLSVLVDGWNYSAFSFFPAIPWAAMHIPEGFGNPQRFMLFGLAEADDLVERNRLLWSDVTVRHGIFLCACLTVVVGAVAMFSSRTHPVAHTAVGEFFFVLLAFPLIKQLCSVFGCTSIDVWVATAEETSNGRIRTRADLSTVDGQMAAAAEAYGVKPFCMLQDDGVLKADAETGVITGHRVVPGAQCMDNDPTRQCWDDASHLWHVAAVVILLTPYYISALQNILSMLLKQSVMAKDARWAFVSFQSKTFLAVVASVYGDCQPKTMLSLVGMVIGCQIAMLKWYNRKSRGWVQAYSGVLALNCAHSAGLYLAAINWCFAVFVVSHYGDYPEATTRCMNNPFTGNDASGAGSASGVSYGYSLSYQSMANAGGTDAGSAGGHGGGRGNANEPPTFLIWLVVNVLFVAGACLRYRWLVSFSRWETETWHPPLSDNRVLTLNTKSECCLEVDYALVAARVRAAQAIAKQHSIDAKTKTGVAAVEPFVLQLSLIERGNHQQMQKATLDYVLGARGITVAIKAEKLYTMSAHKPADTHSKELIDQASGWSLVNKLLAIHDTAEVGERLSLPWGCFCCACEHAGCLEDNWSIAKVGCRCVKCCFCCRCKSHRHRLDDGEDSDIGCTDDRDITTRADGRMKNSKKTDSEAGSGSGGRRGHTCATCATPVFASDSFPFLHAGAPLPWCNLVDVDVSGFEVRYIKSDDFYTDFDTENDGFLLTK